MSSTRRFSVTLSAATAEKLAALAVRNGLRPGEVLEQALLAYEPFWRMSAPSENSEDQMRPTKQAASQTNEYAVQQAIAADRRRMAEIARLCAQYGVTHLARNLVLEGVSIEAARAEIMLAAAAKNGVH